MAKKSTAGVVVPSNLSFLRSVEPTPGIMSGVVFRGEASLRAVHDRSEGAVVLPVQVTVTTVRGTIANDDKKEPKARVGTGEKALNAANIATVEQALLPADAAHLLVTTTIRFAGHASAPAMCNEPEFRDQLKAFVAEYANKGGFQELAVRYLLNVANGSWLWRNRFGEDMEVSIDTGSDVLIFGEDDIDMSLGFSTAAIIDAAKREKFEALSSRVAAALAGGPSVSLKVAGLVRMGEGAEVYPSQEFASASTEKVIRGAEADKVAKVLSKQRGTDGTMVATMHARKIGNAIRTIDTWHGNDGVGQIAVEVYGANTHQNEAHRVSGNDLYTYLRQPDLLNESLANEGVTGVHHYVVACLIRGGVFGFASAAKKGAAAAETSEA